MELDRRSLRDEEGSVLIAVVGIMVVLTVLAIGAYAMSTDNLLQSKRERARAQALTVAEAGLEQVLWRVKVGQQPTSTAPFFVDVPPLGRCMIEWAQTGTNFHVIATGSASSTPGITRTISSQAMSLSMWDMLYADGPVNPGSNGHINGGGTFHGSAYMRGNWPPSNGDAAFEQGPFFVKGGGILLGGNASIGKNTSEGVDVFCDGTVNMNNIDPRTRIHTVVPDLPMPPQGGNELSDARRNAGFESGDGVQGVYGGGGPANEERRTTGESTGVPTPLMPPYVDRPYTDDVKNGRRYKVVDNNDDQDGSGSITAFYIGKDATGKMLPEFGKPYDVKTGHSPDDFAWDPNAGTKGAGVLTVQGTVFIDAKDVYIRDVEFAGKGTLICSGNVHITGIWEPACFTVAPIATSELDPQGYPMLNCVGISASGLVEEFSPNGYGPFYSAVSWSMNPSANADQFHGEVVAPEITLGKHSDVWCTTGMGSNVPPSMPGGAGQIVTVCGWHEGRN